MTEKNTDSTSTNTSVNQRDPRPAERSRRQRANQLNAAAKRYYRDHWTAKHIADVEEEAGEFSHRDESKSVLQLLEYADVDVIVDTYETQVFIQEKFVQASTNGDCLLIRWDNGSDQIAPEADRLRAGIHDPTVFIPGVFGFGRASSATEFGWFWLVDVHQFVESWMADDGCAPTEGVFHNQDGTKSLMFPPTEVAKSGALLATWGETPDRIQSNPEGEAARVLSTVSDGGQSGQTAMADGGRSTEGDSDE